MLQIDNLCASYGKKEIIHNISLDLKNGTVTNLLGPNGCGKSTLLKSVEGILPKVTGKILIDGENVKTMKKNIRSQKLAYLSQGRSVPDITASALVLHGRFPYLNYPRKYGKSDIEKARLAMEKMGIEEYADKNMRTLSGGMRQKVYIAMALAQEAGTIMLDEPAVYLDIKEQVKLDRIIKKLATEGKTVLSVSHDIIDSLKISDYIAVMKDGCIKFYGTPAQVLESGIIKDVFGIDIRSVEFGGKIEYFFNRE